MGILIFNEIIILPVKQLKCDNRYSRLERRHSIESKRSIALGKKHRDYNHIDTIIVEEVEEEGNNFEHLSLNDNHDNPLFKSDAGMDGKAPSSPRRITA